MGEDVIDEAYLETKYEKDKRERKALHRIIKLVGGTSYLAKMIGYNASTVSSWSKRGKASKAGALAICSHPRLVDEITIQELRSDAA